jgi:1-acyl-sn-glycerol-3-phosphate acyltransferase
MIERFGRSAWRTMLFLLSLLQIAAGFARMRMQSGSAPTARQRAEWLHCASILLLRRLGMTASAAGPLPQHGLLVSNHLGYLDVLVFAAAVPCVFVSKAEVRSWPILGPLTAMAGTIFIDRRSQAGAAEVTERIRELLECDVPVLLFPEGTSSDGAGVLRFHPSLFESAIRAGAPITAASVTYAAPGVEERELCYYGDDQFAVHLWQTLGRAGIHAVARFAADSRVYPDRKTAALAARNDVLQLRVLDRHYAAGEMPQEVATSCSSLSL